MSILQKNPYMSLFTNKVTTRRQLRVSAASFVCTRDPPPPKRPAIVDSEWKTTLIAPKKPVLKEKNESKNKPFIPKAKEEFLSPQRYISPPPTQFAKPKAVVDSQMTTPKTLPPWALTEDDLANSFPALVSPSSSIKTVKKESKPSKPIQIIMTGREFEAEMSKCSKYDKDKPLPAKIEKIKNRQIITEPFLELWEKKDLSNGIVRRQNGSYRYFGKVRRRQFFSPIRRRQLKVVY